MPAHGGNLAYMLARTIQVIVLVVLVAIVFLVWGERWETYSASILAVGIAWSSEASSWTHWYDGINPSAWMHDLGQGMASVFGGGSRER